MRTSFGVGTFNTPPEEVWFQDHRFNDGFLKNNEELLILRNGIAKSAKSAKFFDFLCVHFGRLSASFASLAVQSSCLTLT
jgi:hypothetical protein